MLSSTVNQVYFFVNGIHNGFTHFTQHIIVSDTTRATEVMGGGRGKGLIYACSDQSKSGPGGPVLEGTNFVVKSNLSDLCSVGGWL